MEYKENIIIRNLSDMSIIDCMFYVASVIRQGRVSDNGKSYCYITQFKEGICVSARRRKRSDVFIIWKEKNQIEHNYRKD